jgi:hypothetical protein
LFYDEIRLINFSFPHSESEFVWEVPLGLRKFWDSEYLVVFKMHNCWTKMPSVLFYDEIRWTKLDKIVILPYFPYNPKMKLRLEVLFKKFHPRINLTTLFFTKSYLLNTIKPFSGHENRSLKKSQKPLQPLGTWTSKFWVSRTSSWCKRLREPKFQLSRSYVLGCRWGTHFCQRRRRRRVTDGKNYCFFHVLWLFIGKKHDLSETKFSKFLVWNQYFQYIPLWWK